MSWSTPKRTLKEDLEMLRKQANGQMTRYAPSGEQCPFCCQPFGSSHSNDCPSLDAKCIPYTVEIVNQIVTEGYFAEEVAADGPWHARFLFCGKYGFRPNEVDVDSPYRGCGTYWCSHGEMKDSPFLNPHAMMKKLDHLSRTIP